MKTLKLTTQLARLLLLLLLLFSGAFSAVIAPSLPEAGVGVQQNSNNSNSSSSSSNNNAPLQSSDRNGGHTRNPPPPTRKTAGQSGQRLETRGTPTATAATTTLDRSTSTERTRTRPSTSTSTRSTTTRTFSNTRNTTSTTRSSTTSNSSTTGSGPRGKQPPHIVMIVVDDLGWNDVDWRDEGLHTPVMTRLASKGLTLTQAYVQPVCSPSRAAFLSGLYPYHLGLQHDSLRATQKAYLPANVTTLPQHLQRLGYRTHMAGKWHLGFCNWRYTPTHRGFHSFVGFYNAIQDYYTHIGHHNGYDFRRNEDVYYEAKGTYSAFIFTQYIEQVIRDHNASQPLFVYLPYQSVHGPLQVPQVYIDKFCSHIKDDYRRSKCGMIAVLDEGVGNVTDALKARGLLDDTLLLVTTDNGGPINEGANNWPLRGSKTTLWEGGTRATAFLHYPNVLGRRRRNGDGDGGHHGDGDGVSPGKVYDGVIHAVDWLPTLVEAAGGGPVTGVDGVSQWQSLLNGKVPSARTEFLYNMDELKNNSALRQGKYKLLQGNPGKPDKWYPPPSFSSSSSSSSSFSSISSSSSSSYPYQGTEGESLWSHPLLPSNGPLSRRLVDILLRESSRFHDRRGDSIDFNNSNNNSSSSSSSSLLLSLFFPKGQNFHHHDLRQQQPEGEGAAVVSMTSEGGSMMSSDDEEKGPEYQLYDLEADPNEHTDVKNRYPDVFKRMRARLDEYRKSLVPANFPPHDPDALPSHFHGVWSPGWC